MYLLYPRVRLIDAGDRCNFAARDESWLLMPVSDMVDATQAGWGRTTLRATIRKQNTLNCVLTGGSPGVLALSLLYTATPSVKRCSFFVF